MFIQLLLETNYNAAM